MAIVSDRQTFQVPQGSTSAIPISHSLGVTPQYIELRTFGAATGLSTGDIRHGHGCSDGTRHYAYGAEISDNRSTTPYAAAASRYSYSSTAVLLEVAHGGGSPSLTGVLNFTSWSSTQVVLTPSDAFAHDAYVEIIFLAGFTNVYVDAFALTAASGNYSRTAPGFQPDYVRTFFNSNASTQDVTAQRAVACIGNTTASAQHCLMIERDVANSNYTFGGFRTGYLAMSSAVGATWGDLHSFVSFDTNGYTFTRTATNGRGICHVCFKGGLPVVGTFTARTASTGTISLTTTGHTSAFLHVIGMSTNTADTTVPVEPADGVFGHAVTAAANKSGSAHYFDFNNETLDGSTKKTDPLAQQTETTIYRSFTRTGTDTLSEAQAMTVQSIVYQTITLNQSVIDANATLIGFVSMGNPAPAASGFYYRAMLEAHH